ncbi:alpha/beta fold hydrolase [Bradyrhizobium sp. S69]|uniref:alpha/beta fold hydrolase n=1 Tax=Bradyrhizobium sp. S69 TaxID=1641856 RepID=UPI00131A6785|nr:alpha/beta fold hydrolase [Bradyrhizobium sp. S69]
MIGGGCSDGVVLLHGIARTSRSLNKIETALHRSRFTTLNLNYASRSKPLEVLAADIAPDIARFTARTDGSIHFVGHSMGGLLIRVYLARYRPPRLGRVVMLGTPNGGSEVADILQRFAIYRAFYGPAGLQLSTQQDPALRALPPIDYDLGIVAGVGTIDPISSFLILPRPNDGKVSVERTRLDGMTDHTIVRASHPGLLRHPAAIEQTIAFLRDGRFAPASA